MLNKMLNHTKTDRTMKPYIKPSTEVTRYESESVLYSVSSNAGIGVGGYGDYDPR